ncbi:hypothetical protein P280DRAFT_541632 [Massarina eburnea CBS 473.64]|uniref:Uncharacterized protein n=1 Tax=Massarina eburnea CBS 473.64 TaxID=1395130 RepID=A0A6A6S7C3_9PLEO|nr:hypothetical protein P280DRAFT_541632 [Massarina eburnea CBS 473.64]
MIKPGRDDCLRGCSDNSAASLRSAGWSARAYVGTRAFLCQEANNFVGFVCCAAAVSASEATRHGQTKYRIASYQSLHVIHCSYSNSQQDSSVRMRVVVSGVQSGQGGSASGVDDQDFASEFQGAATFHWPGATGVGWTPELSLSFSASRDGSRRDTAMLPASNVRLDENRTSPWTPQLHRRLRASPVARKQVFSARPQFGGAGNEGRPSSTDACGQLLLFES